MSKNYSVLIVEDSEGLRSALEKNIPTRIEGAKVYTAADSGEMLEQLDARRYDMMVFDLGCGDEDFRTLRRIREERSSMVILGVSGFAEWYVREGVPVDKLLDKDRDIVDAIRECLGVERHDQ